jgi:site-specific DNA-methyltransferase (adenine-specific)
MKINIHLGDSLKAMDGMKNNKYGLAIVDPEFGIDIAKSARLVTDKGLKAKDWDSSPIDYNYFSILFMVSKNQIIWGGNYYELPANKHCLIWDKKQPEDLSFGMFDYAWTSFDGSNKIFRQSATKNGENIDHPTKKPIQLYKWLLKNYGFNKDGSKRTIFDSHGGSMSIVIACIDMGFDIDIWEIDEDYYRDATNRIKRYLAQGDLTREKVEIKFFD